MLNTRGPPTKDYFRSLGNGGLISYTEYLFLLCILTSKRGEGKRKHTDVPIFYS